MEENQISASEKARREFERLVSEKFYRVVGQFQNELKEEFVVYLTKWSEDFFVTGDEMLWEIGWQWRKYSRLKLTQGFSLSDLEASEIEKLVGAFEGKEE